MRKLAALILAITIIMTFAIPAYAAPTDSSSVSSTEPGGTGGTAVESKLPAAILAMLENADTAQSETQFMLTITRPDEETDSTYKKSYVISGDTWNTGYTDVRVVLGVFDEDTGSYKLMNNADLESSWDVGNYGAFAKEITLTKGANKIRILAYRTSEKGDFDSSSNVQVTDFTIRLLDSNIVTKVMNSVVELLDLKNQFLNK